MDKSRIMNKIYLVIISLFVLMISCKDDEPVGDPSQVLVFESLVIEKDTVIPGESVGVTANVSGYSLEYHWSATGGDVIGAGGKVTYVAPPCDIGINAISCQVVDGNGNSKTKTVNIVVE